MTPRRLKLGSCPDSWGVWFADDPRQTPWHRFLDELAAAGYEWLELGPYGYLPTDPARLADEVAARGLQVAAGTVAGHSALYDPDAYDSILAGTREVAALTAALGAEHLVFVPVPGYRDDRTGAFLHAAELDADEWATMTARDEPARPGRRRGVRPPPGLPPARGLPRRDPEADRAVPRRHRPAVTSRSAWTPATWPTGGRTCPASSGRTRTGSATCTSSRWTRRSWTGPSAEELAFGQAVALGASCEPPAGLPDVPTVLSALSELDAELFVVVEQDMYPVDFDVPLPIATRTRTYLNSEGLGSPLTARHNPAPLTPPRTAGPTGHPREDIPMKWTRSRRLFPALTLTAVAVLALAACSGGGRVKTTDSSATAPGRVTTPVTRSR